MGGNRLGNVGTNNSFKFAIIKASNSYSLDPVTYFLCTDASTLVTLGVLFIEYHSGQ